MQPSDLSIEGWRIEDRLVLALLEKIKKAGVTLEEYVYGKLYRGIITGYNEAFVIDEGTKKRLIRQDKNSAEVIKPLLRGRDVKRYSIEWHGLYLIYVPNGWTNENRKKQDAERFFKTEFPAIYDHLRPYQTALMKRDDQGEYWWESRPLKHLNAFESSKIVMPDISPRNSFAMDETGRFYTINTVYFLSSSDKALLGILNSSSINFYYRRLTSTVRGDYFRFFKQYVETLPIATPSEKQRLAIEERVEKILAAKKKDGKADTSELENEIDQLVYKLYGLTEEEIKIVEEGSK